MLAAIKKLIKSGENVNEVEAAGNTPLHSAAYEGWLEGVEVLLSLGAKIDASNNAGDRPYHWAENMGHKEVMDFIVQVCLLQGHTCAGTRPPLHHLHALACWQYLIVAGLPP